LSAKNKKKDSTGSLMAKAKVRHTPFIEHKSGMRKTNEKQAHIKKHVKKEKYK
jgi:hypothetical protein